MTTPVNLFDQQMRFLNSNGYYVKRALEVVRQLRLGKPLDFKTIVLTFDDGFKDNHTHALPILRKYRLPATIFLVNSIKKNSARYLDWVQIREMQDSGLIDFGCHSATHQKLRGLPDDQLQQETNRAKLWLEDRLQREVPLFAYPFGSYRTWDHNVLMAVKQAGFIGAFTSIFGLNTIKSDCFLLRRSRISWWNEIAEFKQLLEGAYDWYAHFQKMQSFMK